ncbi:C-type lectin domain family 11 member A [Elysia marginata]|uniref:C-type lectin domain family 11 member A n=1 Tax=Elysia marginata TaxID=1093978 RepID=A0AAV4JI07_9GAST|nr:C-type lectin domain family 11 member A [Elysia marginata]
MVLIIGGVFLLAFAAHCSAQSVRAVCPEDALIKRKGEYDFRVKNGTCFLFMASDKVTHDEAELQCMKIGGFLAMPKTKDVNDFLLREMKLLDKPQPMWIGMHQGLTQGKFVWQDGSDVVDWGNFDWANGGFFGTGDEHCIALDPGDGKWHDYSCYEGFLSSLSLFNTYKLPFVCEFP